MIKFGTLWLTAVLLSTPPASAQHQTARSQSAPRANQGHIPPPPARSGLPSGSHAEQLGDGKVNESQHVNHNQWFGHERPDGPRFHLDQPFAHGRFPHVGPGLRYDIPRIDRKRHWFWFPGGFYFEVAAWDWPLFANWCWDCGSDFVIYDDPDHVGWYLLYNVHTGLYVHAQYMGM